jgi:hypothetical protein
MIEIIIKTIYAIVITQTWIYSKPTIAFRELLCIDESFEDSKIFIQRWLALLLNCAMCSGFWIALSLFAIPLNIVVHVIAFASIASIGAELLSRKLGN